MHNSKYSLIFNSMIIFLVLCFAAKSFAQTNNCTEDILTNNNNGEILTTSAGKIFETIAGDNIDAMLWLPVTNLLVCGPKNFSYKGKRYSIYQITNTDDEEQVSGFLLNQTNKSINTDKKCYSSVIQKPTPFMGNNDEIFILLDNSVWQILYEYEYMYEYNPEVIVCPSDGYIIVGGKKLNAQRLR